MAVFFIFQKSLNDSCQRQTAFLPVHNQNHRCIRNPRHLIGAGMGSASSHPVIIPHGPFHHCHLLSAGFFCQQPSHLIRVQKKTVQIITRYSQHIAVKHRVNIIWTTFIGHTGNLPSFQKLQHPAGHYRLPAAACGSGKQDTWNILFFLHKILRRRIVG